MIYQERCACERIAPELQNNQPNAIGLKQYKEVTHKQNRAKR